MKTCNVYKREEVREKECSRVSQSHGSKKTVNQFRREDEIKFPVNCFTARSQVPLPP
jgi:hypothetical protein